MYRKKKQTTPSKKDFSLSPEWNLCEDNRWVVMAELIPWSEFEEEYALCFSESMGAPAIPFRTALGALIIKEKLGISDRETVEQIKENPYLQYFIGQKTYSNKPPFDPSMMVHFRQRISANIIQKVNKKMVKNAREEKEECSGKSSEKGEPENRGKLLLDATVGPADIKYPTDVGLLNEVRKVTEKIIDVLYECLKGKSQKPRTYRKKARKDYLAIAKKRRTSRKERRKAQKKQLQYIERNLKHIEKLIEKGATLESLSRGLYRRFLVGNEIYRQQKCMWENNKDVIEDRIVSLTQPHIRPIKRGKAKADTEFGSKLSASCFDGYVFLEHLSLNNYNESGEFKNQVEAYKEYTGYYPESVHVDKIYRTRDNRNWCKEKGIRMSGSPLGRPPKNTRKEAKKQAQLDERVRNEIEGKFGLGKRRYSLNRVMTKLAETSETTIAITFLVINLSTLLRRQVGLSFFVCITVFFVNLLRRGAIARA
ncbi:MAG: IS5 family transposase [Oscillatoria sp. SIO1A7]|nr:IS5 family transposase [Oscillatoria sp. SIO1A7]